MSKELNIVSKEQAVKLKKLGFDWKQDRHYVDSNDGLYPVGNINSDGEYSEFRYFDYFYYAPTVALALKWIRDARKPIVDDFSCLSGKDGIGILNDDYESHEIAILDYALDFLLQQKEIQERRMRETGNIIEIHKTPFVGGSPVGAETIRVMKRLREEGKI